MRGEADLRRLAEIGVDTYEPRAAVAQSGAAAASDGGASPSAIGAVLIGDGSTQRASGLLDAVMRAFAFAKVSCTRADAGDEAVLADARALVAFGEGRGEAPRSLWAGLTAHGADYPAQNRSAFRVRNENDRHGGFRYSRRGGPATTVGPPPPSPNPTTGSATADADAEHPPRAERAKRRLR
jgi:hypothetical protein